MRPRPLKAANIKSQVNRMKSRYFSMLKGPSQGWETSLRVARASLD